MISIHAPTRGATVVYIQFINLTIISIHAPTRGATSTELSFELTFIDFNPRSHERSDVSDKLIMTQNLDFNPRSHERSDRAKRDPGRERAEFQSTLPREERQWRPGMHQSIQQISIHAPTRGATINSMQATASSRFQSTLPREERQWCSEVNSRCRNFNPRSHERSDAYLISLS